MSRQFRNTLNYSDIYIEPNQPSYIEHRANCNTSIKFCGQKLKLPVIASPMQDVCDGEMARNMWLNGCLGIIHRFMDVKDQVHEYSLATRYGNGGYSVGTAIGVGKDWNERVSELYTVGCVLFCIDVANGGNILVKKVTEVINKSKHLSGIKLIAGNVATKECFRFLAETGVDAIRVGIGTGSHCSTKSRTAIYVPIVTALLDCLEERDKLGLKTQIIACGGCGGADDFSKALALGADAVMLGRLLAATKEAPSLFVKKDGRVYKLYRGAASYGAQLYRGQKPKYVEGEEDWIPYYGKLHKLLEELSDGLRSSMSYINASTLAEYRANASFVKI